MAATALVRAVLYRTCACRRAAMVCHEQLLCGTPAKFRAGVAGRSGGSCGVKNVRAARLSRRYGGSFGRQRPACSWLCFCQQLCVAIRGSAACVRPAAALSLLRRRSVAGQRFGRHKK
ncbi:hypothetical protein NPIL_355491 [Nephila pilipes]|uniref:Uncharacterized protein n=1 Tax=Nephila pilipes TaxID=299642 RepID=A0A8X6QSM4_NEPPI|nr:hypothetical protein NPIL_355491 [Nephila pilipes]